MRLSHSVSLALLIAQLVPALAWKGGTRGGVLPIAQVLVAVSDSLIRKLDARQGEAAGGQRYRVTGRWDHEHMNTDTWGIHAQEIERLPAHRHPTAAARAAAPQGTGTGRSGASTR